ncbi:hypothetical protein DVH05_009897 [Phytophthora capsici]|nr:hypothetical protein DVH05_009897 [Phytophthora capsici]
MARGKKTSKAEDAMIVSAYKFFLKTLKGETRGAGQTRDLVRECIGGSTATIARVWGAYEVSQNRRKCREDLDLEDLDRKDLDLEDLDLEDLDRAGSGSGILDLGDPDLEDLGSSHDRGHVKPPVTA